MNTNYLMDIGVGMPGTASSRVQAIDDSTTIANGLVAGATQFARDVTGAVLGSYYMAVLTITAAALMAGIAYAGTPPLTPPAGYAAVRDDFERGTLAAWSKTGASNLWLAPPGCLSATGLSVAITTGYYYVYRDGLKPTDEYYLSFRFHPNSVVIPDQGGWVPNKSMEIAAVRGSNWIYLASLMVRAPTGQGYRAYLRWQDASQTYQEPWAMDTALSNDWQEITLGCRIGDWIALWINGTRVLATNVTHASAYANVVTVGKGSSTSSIQTSGTTRYDTVRCVIAAYSGMYYVATSGNDTNSGTIAQPWRSLQRATDTLTAGGTAIIRAGTYEERLQSYLSGEVDAGTTNWITYAAYPGETPVLNGATQTFTSGGMVELSRSAFIRVAGLVISNSPEHGVSVRNSQNILVESNATYNTGSSGVYVQFSTNVTVRANDVRRACNGSSKAQECITVAEFSRQVEVSGNRVHDYEWHAQGGEGIDVKNGSSFVRVFGNDVHDLPGKVGLYIDSYQEYTHDIEVHNNRVKATTGIAIGSEKGGLLENVAVYNNVVYECEACGISMGVWVDDGPRHSIFIVNNTVYSNGWGYTNGGIVVNTTNAENVVVRNNIASQNCDYQISVPTQIACRVAVDYNLIDGYRGHTWNDETKGSNYVEGAARFVNAGGLDFHLLQGSPAIDAAATNGAPAFDADGLQRPIDGDVDGTARCDIGAFEYVPEPGTWLLAVLLVGCLTRKERSSKH